MIGLLTNDNCTSGTNSRMQSTMSRTVAFKVSTL